MTVNLSIKDVPDAWAQRLRERAARNHRSLQGELMSIIERAALQEELAHRFDLSFAIYSSAWISARRRERGWGVNPWETHPRFIVSYNMLRGSQRARGQHPAKRQHQQSRSALVAEETHARYGASAAS